MHPKWSPKGDELFFVQGNRLMAAEIQTRPRFNLNLPHQLFSIAEIGVQLLDFSVSGPSAAYMWMYDVSSDGRRFVVVQRVDEGKMSRLTVVQNWVRQFEGESE